MTDGVLRQRERREQRLFASNRRIVRSGGGKIETDSVDELFADGELNGVTADTARRHDGRSERDGFDGDDAHSAVFQLELVFDLLRHA